MSILADADHDVAESYLYLIRDMVKDLRLTRAGMIDSAGRIGELNKTDCPLAGDENPDHAALALFMLEGWGLINWECPFCGERFSE